MEVVAAAFVAGLLGGVHCIGMCGGIAGALGGGTRTIPIRPGAFAMAPAGIAVRAPPERSLGRLLGFNFGRIGSYAIAGAAAGAIGNLAVLAGPVDTARTVAFVAAQAMLVMLGLYIAGWTAFFPRFEAAGGAIWNRLQPVRRQFFPADSMGKAIAAGAVWGWVPCGLVYGMLPMALAGAGPVKGAAILVAFGLGTLPWMLAAGTVGARLTGALRQHRWIRIAAGALLIMLAVASLLQLMHRH